jgi:hypothetical protein
MDTITSTALQTAESLLPTILLTAGGVAAAGNPAVASAAALAPVALQLLNSAMQFSQAGVMTPAQLAALFTTIGQNINASHAQWEAMNAAQPQA